MPLRVKNGWSAKCRAVDDGVKSSWLSRRFAAFRFRSGSMMGGKRLQSVRQNPEVATMRILLQPPRPDAPSFEVDFEIQKALVALHGYSIKIRGAGRFGDGAAAIVLQRETDADRALAALKDAGIRASMT
jgi:hypothetical protein